MREISERDITWVMEGAAVLGAGGGGNAYLAGLDVKRVLRFGGRLRICGVDELEGHAVGAVVSGMGAPTVGIERLPIRGRFSSLIQRVGEVIGRPVQFVAIGEIGGANALRPLSGAAELGLPVVDADPMGRAFPELQMCTYMIQGLPADPMVLNDGKGVEAVFHGIPDSLTAERYGRALTWAMGGNSGLALGVVTAEQVRHFGIPGTLSLAERLGRAMAEARRLKRETLTGIIQAVPKARYLFEGKIQDVSRHTSAGFARGIVAIDGLNSWHGERLRIDFQNEFLVAYREGDKTALLTVPDLLVLIDQESGRALGSENVRYGLRVHVLGLPAPFELKTAQALTVVGPSAFGYDLPFQPLSGDLLGREAPAAAVH